MFLRLRHTGCGASLLSLLHCCLVVVVGDDATTKHRWPAYKLRLTSWFFCNYSSDLVAATSDWLLPPLANGADKIFQDKSVKKNNKKIKSDFKFNNICNILLF